MKRILSIILVALLLSTVALPVSATTVEEVQPRYKYIASFSSSMVIDSSTGISTCSSFLKANPGYQVNMVCKLQKWGDSSWETVKTWEASGDAYASVSGRWAVYSYYDYRVHVTAFITDANGNLVETATSIDYADYV